MGKPDYDFPPGQEPERPWPIDPRPAIREIMSLRNVPPFREQTPQERRFAMIGSIVVLTLAAASYWAHRLGYPPVPKQYVSSEKLSSVAKGMSQKEVLIILGEPPKKAADCWTYDFSEEEVVQVHFGSMFKVTEVERKPRRRK